MRDVARPPHERPGRCDDDLAVTDEKTFASIIEEAKGATGKEIEGEEGGVVVVKR